jgi:hypothetical protein
MSEITSFGNLVNALNSVRDDYNEHLKSVPQYEAFLLVESSTQRVVETLHGLVNSPAPSMAAEVISSFETAKTKFKEHLKSVAEYRALLALDKLIIDVSIDLGVQPAPGQTVPAQVEPETPPHAIAPTQPDHAVSTAEHAVTQPQTAEIASLQEVAATQPEPDLAVPAAERPTTPPEAAEIASPHEVAAEPEPNLAASVAEYRVTQPGTMEIASPLEAAANEPAQHTITQAEAAEIASPHETAATEPEPVAVSAVEHWGAQPEAAEVASPQEVAATEPEPDLAVSAAEHMVTQPEAAEITPSTQSQYSIDAVPDDEIAAAVHNLDHVAEPPAVPFDEGSERAA